MGVSFGVPGEHFWLQCLLQPDRGGGFSDSQTGFAARNGWRCAEVWETAASFFRGALSINMCTCRTDTCHMSHIKKCARTFIYDQSMMLVSVGSDVQATDSSGIDPTLDRDSLPLWTLTGICFVLLFCGRNHGLSSQLERTEHTLPLTVMEMETQGLRLLEGVKTFALRSDRPLPPTPHTSCWKRLLRPSARRVASFGPAAHTKQGLSKKLLYRSVTTSLPQWLPQCTSSLSACLVLV